MFSYSLITSPLQWKPFHILTVDQRRAVLAKKTWAPEERDKRMRLINILATRISYHQEEQTVLVLRRKLNLQQ